MKAKDLDTGKIVWYKDLVLGIKDLTLEDKYNECEVSKVVGNKYDYELTPNSTEMYEDLEMQLELQEAEENA